jgi:hypothetical protein
LSGKVKKDGNLEAGCRVAWTSEKQQRQNQAFISFDKFNNEPTWKLLDLMEKCGKNHGRNSLV